MSRLTTLPLAAMLVIAAAGPSLADAQRPSLQDQEAQALARLSLADLRSYFEARRQLERKSSDQRLTQFRSLEECLERTRQRSGADACLDRARQQRERDRAQWTRELMSLRQRYQLPNMDDR